MGSKSSDPNKAAMRQQEAQMKRLDAIDLPQLEEYILQSPELVGLLEAEQLGDTQLSEVSLDPELRANQMKALQALSEQADEGLTAQDKYQMEQLLGDVSAQERSALAGIDQDMARRGMESSGVSERNKRAALQSGANNARAQAMQMAAQGQQNRMSALQALGSQSAQMEGTDYARQAQLASARDAISQANAANRQNVNAQNLAARQAIANQRANVANQQSALGNEIAQQNFANQITKATGQGQVSSNMSNIAANAAARPSAFQSALGGAATGASVGGSIYGPVGAGYGAAIGAGAGVLGSMFADGGIVGSEQDALRRAQGDYELEQLRGVQGTYEQEVADDKATSQAMIKGLGALSKMLGSSEQQPKSRVQTSYTGVDPKNIMSGYQAQQFANPFTAADGGVAYASDGMGGVIDSGMDSFAGDRIDAQVNDGEVILNAPQQQRMMDMIRGKISVDELGDDDIIEGVPRSYRDELHEKVEEEKEGSSRSKGLEKLLDILGK